MESQKIINLLDSNDNESQKFATKRWYIINDQNTGNNAYGNGEDGTEIKFETKVFKPNLCSCSDAYILVTGDMQNKPANSVVAFKNCAPFRTCDVTINDEHVEKAEDSDIVMPMYNLLEYSDNYQDSTGILQQFKRDEPPDDNANVANDTTSLVYKSKLISGTDDNNVNNVKLVVPLKYISNFFRSSELPLVNCKTDLELTWHKDCMISSADAAGGQVVSFMITNTKLDVPIVTLSTKDNNNLTKQLNAGFKRSIYWNQYVSKPFPETPHKKTGITRFALDAAFQGVNRLFVLAFEDTRADEAADAPALRNLVANQVIRNSYRKYFVSRADITSYNVLIDGRNFYDQPINDSIRKYDEIRKIATGKGDNYATGCLLDYDYFKKYHQLIAVDLSKQRELDADPRAIQQIEFIGMLKTRSNVFTILEKSKETILEFYKGTAKSRKQIKTKVYFSELING